MQSTLVARVMPRTENGWNSAKSLTFSMSPHPKRLESRYENECKSCIIQSSSCGYLTDYVSLLVLLGRRPQLFRILPQVYLQTNPRLRRLHIRPTIPRQRGCAILIDGLDPWFCIGTLSTWSVTIRNMCRLLSHAKDGQSNNSRRSVEAFAAKAASNKSNSSLSRAIETVSKR